MKAKLIKALRDPRKAAVKAARKARKLRRLISEGVRLQLGLGNYDKGAAEDFLDLKGKEFPAWFRAKTCPLWDEASLTGIRSRCPEREKAGILQAAARIRAHDFDYLGSGPTHVGTGKFQNGYEGIDWHLDYRHGSRWPSGQLHKFVKVVKGDGSDIKYLWELSRLHQLITLGQAFVLSGDPAYAREYRLQVLDWLSANPTDTGPNWQCCMEVGIRAANLALSLFLVKSSGEIDEDFSRKVMVSLWRHCDHIVHNLEYSDDLTSNHYLSNIAGLHMVCALFPELKGAGRWLGFAHDEISKEMFKQVHPDGTDFEASSCYHRLVLELFFYPALVGRLIGKPFPPAYQESLERMFRVVHALTKHDGCINQIGDNDSGRYLNFNPDGDGLNHSYLLALGGHFFSKPELLLKELPDAGESLWVFPGGNLGAMLASAPSAKAVFSAAYADTGWYIYRDERIHMHIVCGPNGQGPSGGHAHNDKLSFCLQVDGEDVFVDPGTYVYTSDEAARNRFRATDHHNTVSVGGKEQNPFAIGIPFYLSDATRAKVLRWSIGEDGFEFEGTHQGYEPIRHFRRIVYSRRAGTLSIQDRFEGVTGPTRFEFFFQLKPGTEARVAGAEASLRFERAEVQLKAPDHSTSIALEKSEYSPCYGRLLPGAKIVLRTDRSFDFTHVHTITLAAH